MIISLLDYITTMSLFYEKALSKKFKVAFLSMNLHTENSMTSLCFSLCWICYVIKLSFILSSIRLLLKNASGNCLAAFKSSWQWAQTQIHAYPLSMSYHLRLFLIQKNIFHLFTNSFNDLTQKGDVWSPLPFFSTVRSHQTPLSTVQFIRMMWERFHNINFGR